MFRSTARLHDEDEGFTLIELLVVIIIIGILAAIAIPVFLAQRTQAWDTAAKSDLRQAATAEESYQVDSLTYGTFSDVIASGLKVPVSKDVTLTVVKYDVATGYCLSAKHAKSGHVFYYDSNSGGLQKKGSAGCPVSTTGVAGDSISG